METRRRVVFFIFHGSVSARGSLVRYNSIELCYIVCLVCCEEWVTLFLEFRIKIVGEREEACEYFPRRWGKS